MISKRMVTSSAEQGVTVHILHHGLPLCRFTDAMPNVWPPGHRWVGLDVGAEVTCEKCKVLGNSLFR
jgi:disulfide bond formation protein DsbB